MITDYLISFYHKYLELLLKKNKIDFDREIEQNIMLVDGLKLSSKSDINSELKDKVDDFNSIIQVGIRKLPPRSNRSIFESSFD